MSNLITLPRLAELPNMGTIVSNSPAYAQALVTAASDDIRAWCCRTFTLQSFTEYLSPGVYNGEPTLLREYPVTEISRVAADAQPVLTVTNTNPTTNQRATVETTTTGVKLVTVASAVPTTTTLLYATYPTLNALAGAINAVSTWSATVTTGGPNNTNYGLYPSADLKPIQGAASALGSGGVTLAMWVESVPPMADGYSSVGWGSGAWRCDQDKGALYLVLPRGPLQVRVDYTAGYATIPNPIQEACAQYASYLYQQAKSSQVIRSQTLGPFSTTFVGSQPMPKHISTMLNRWTAHDRRVNAN